MEKKTDICAAEGVGMERRVLWEGKGPLLGDRYTDVFLKR